jgi:nucleoside-diphosphate-sugar epimerase
MKTLVTGGLGHIGSYVIRTPFAAEGICVVDDLSTNRYCSLMNLPYPIDFINDGFENLREEFLEQFDVVLHLAAVTDAARGDSESIEKDKCWAHQGLYKKIIVYRQASFVYIPFINKRLWNGVRYC